MSRAAALGERVELDGECLRSPPSLALRASNRYLLSVKLNVGKLVFSA
jgi:hypothetical protein